MSSLKVSVIIPAYNEEKYIKGCLKALKEQSVDYFETIVIDNGSTDKTVDIAASYDVLVQQKVVGNIAAMRNFGASYANGDILAFLDADCIPASTWIEQALGRFGDNRVGVTGCHCSIPKESTWVERAWYSSKPSGKNRVNFIGTANFFVRKAVFEELNGFDENLRTGEDYEFCSRVRAKGYEVISDDRIKVIHLRGPKSLMERLKKEIWYGLETRMILKRKKFYLPFFASIVYICLCSILITSLVLSEFNWAFYAVLCIFFLLTGISLYRCYKSRRFKYFLLLIPIYLFYLTGRSISLIYFFRNADQSKLNL